MKNLPDTTWQQVLRQWFIDPLTPIDNRAAYRRAQALATIALLVFVIAIVMTFIFYMTSPNNQFLRVNVLAVLTIGLTYGLARTNYQRTAVWVFLLVCSLPILYTAAPNPTTDYQELIGLAYLVIPVLIAGFFLPMTSLITFSVIAVVSILAAPLLYENVTQDSNLVDPLGIVGSTAALLILMRLLRAGYLAGDDDGQLTLSQSLHDFAPVGVLVYQAGVIVKVNPVGVKILGAPDAEAVIGQPVANFFQGKLDRESESVRRIEYNGAHALEMRETLHQLDGTTRDTMVISTPVIYKQRLATQIIVSDLTMHSETETRLEALESNYDTIRQAVMDYAYEAEYRDGKFTAVWLSDTFTPLTGYTLEEVNRDGYKSLVHPDDLYKIDASRRQLMKGQMATVEFRLITKAGVTLWIRDHQQPIRDKAGRLVGATGVAQDITQRIESENLLRDYALQQAVIAELGQRALDPVERVDALLQEATQLAVQVLDAEYGLIVEVDEAQANMHRRATVGWQDVPLFVSMPIADSKTQVAYTIRRKEAIVTNNYGNDPRFEADPTYKSYGIRSGVSVLIAVQQRVLGAIAVHTTRDRTFLLEDVNFLQAIANLLAAFLEQHRIRRAEREQRVLAEALRDTAETLNNTLELDEVLERILANLSFVLPHDAAVIMLIEEDSAHAIKQSGFEQYQENFSEMFGMEFDITDLFQDMISDRQPVMIPDVSQDARWIAIEGTEWIQSYIGAPIHYRGRLLGIINVYGARVGRFEKAQEKRLMAFANQASIAIRNARHAHELEQTVTQRTRELEAERKTIQTILESTGEGIFYTVDGVIHYANETLCAMVGYAQHELEGQHVRFLIADDAEIKLGLWDNSRTHINAQDVWRGESRLRRWDGSNFDAGLTLSPGSDRQSVVTLVRDISQFKLLEAQKARFIATASHELRSPISALNTRLYMMQRKPEAMPQHIMMMRDTIERLNRLVEDLLDISRFEKGVIQLRRRHLILQEVVQHEFNLQYMEAESQDLHFEHQMADNPFSIFADPDRLAQVLTNLISNAFKHTKPGGQVVVKVYAQGENVYVAVEDTGAGIAPEDLPHVFDPFFQGSGAKGGAGLGLSISQEIMYLHDGEITVESVLGEGSTFTMCLPGA